MNLPGAERADFFVESLFSFVQVGEESALFFRQFGFGSFQLGVTEAYLVHTDAVPGSGGNQGEETDGGGQGDVHVLQAVRAFQLEELDHFAAIDVHPCVGEGVVSAGAEVADLRGEAQGVAPHGPAEFGEVEGDASVGVESQQRVALLGEVHAAQHRRVGAVDGAVPNDIPRLAVGAAYGWNREAGGADGDIRLVLAGLRDKNAVHESVGRGAEPVGFYVREEAHRLTLDPARSRIDAVLEGAGT